MLSVGAGSREPGEPAPDRECVQVELVDDAGLATGAATVDAAHQVPGLLHRAFSVLLIDPAGRLLLQQRAAAKTRFALRWANACCGHPAPGEAVAVAAARRLFEELGIADIALTEVGVYRYRAADPSTDRVEHEHDHVLVGHVPTDPALRPDPKEIDDLCWVFPDRLAADLSKGCDRYAPWLGGVTAAWRSSQAVQSGPAKPATRLGSDARLKP